MTPVANLTQTMNTLAKTDIRSWGAAWYDIVRNPELVAKARKSGVVDQGFSHRDLLNLANPLSTQSVLDKVTSKAGYLFKQSEETNRLHAFAAGYRDALRNGLGETEAIEYAKQIVNTTQFRFGAENLPAWARGGGGATNALIGQYKSYQMNQMAFLKDLALHDPKGAIKWLTAGMLLGGPDVYGSSLGHELRKGAATMFGGDPKDYKWRGLAGSAGYWVGNQLGVGALPFEDVAGLGFFLPGPAAGHIMSVASAISGKDYTLQGAMRGNTGKDLTPDQRATHATSSLSVQLNRLRQALVMGRSEGRDFRQPETTGQAYGLQPPTGSATTPYSGVQVAQKALGIPSVAQEENRATRGRVSEDIQGYKDLVKKKADAIKRGDPDEVIRLNEEGLKRFGRIPAAGAGAVRGSVGRSNTPTIERQVRGAPKPIRQREKQESQD
jgi:hypothetical protein